MGIPLRIRNGKLVVESSPGRKKKLPGAPKLATSHRKPNSGVKTEIYFPNGKKPKMRLSTSHRDADKLAGRKRIQRNWRVIDLDKLATRRETGQQMITLRDATLPGSIAGRTIRLARMNAEKHYGRPLPEESYALVRAEDWRAVRHLKKWPVDEDAEEDKSEDLSTCLDMVSAIC